MRKAFSVVVAALSLLVAGSALAVDGVIEINQARALAGGVTPGDEPGFPVLIGTPGSYRLTGDLVLGYPYGANTDAIEVYVERFTVSLDLNGFSIRGPGTCSNSGCPVSSCTSGSGRGVYIRSGEASVSISNGAIHGMGAEGVVAEGAVTLEDVVIKENGGGGVSTLAHGAVVGELFTNITRAQIFRNGGMALRAASSARLTESKVSCNAGGVEVGFNSSIIGNTVEYNGTGIFANGGSTVSDNISKNSGGAGIGVAGGSKVTRNVVSNSAREGIYAVDGSTVEGNSVNDCAMSGITVAGSKGAVFGNFLAGNGTSIGSGKALNLGSQVAFSNNVLSNHGNAACDAVSGGVEMGHNTCDGRVSCTMAYCPALERICGPCIY